MSTNTSNPEQPSRDGTTDATHGSPATASQARCTAIAECLVDREVLLAHIERTRAAGGLPPQIEDAEGIEAIVRLVTLGLAPIGDSSAVTSHTRPDTAAA